MGACPRPLVIATMRNARCCHVTAGREITVNLESLGWNAYFEAIWNDMERGDGRPVRVISHNREIWQVVGKSGAARAEASGKLRMAAEEGGDWPAVGDWVVVEGDVRSGLAIREVLARRTAIVRKTAGKKVAAQVLAANVDTVFLVMALDGDFNVRRLERYLAQAWESGAHAIILLNKADLCADSARRIKEVERCSMGVPVHAISAATGKDMESMEGNLKAGETVVLLGSSGVGKSSIVNWLLGTEQQKIHEVRKADSRGHHTTTGRQLLFLECGAMIIDTPGLRELQLWDAEEGVGHAFRELQELSLNCRFRDCQHQGEPGCAIAEAVEDGRLAAGRLENYQKLQREQAFLKRKVDAGLQHEARQGIKKINRAVRELYRQRDEKGKL